MRNKLIISTLALLFCGIIYAQDVTEPNFDQAQISIYPNPAVEFIIVELDGTLQDTEFELNSMIGNKLQIRPEDMGFGKYKISVKDLASGYYFLIIKDEEKRFKKAFRFLKE